MLIKAADITGLSIYTFDTGKKIEDVDDVVYDPQRNKIIALLIDKGGLFKAMKLILFDDIRTIGRDAVIIDSKKAIKSIHSIKNQINEIVSHGIYLTATKIITKDGTYLGDVNDIHFDSQTGRVFYVEVVQTILDHQTTKYVRVEDIMTIGENVTIVKAYMNEMKHDVSPAHQSRHSQHQTTAAHNFF